jgi:hypothetical protein
MTHVDPLDLDYFDVMAVVDLPPAKPFRADCMGEHFRPRARFRRKCCWYHTRDWRAISEAAIRLVEEAHHAGVVPAQRVYEVVRDKTLSSRLRLQDRRALYELLSPSEAIMVGPSATAYTNGQHRGQAMKDLGIRRTIVLRWPACEVDDETEDE